MKTFVLGIEYDGSAYSGWQRQVHSRSIQEEIEKALSFVADQTISLVCAGRTDSGVHACEQIAHFKTTAPRNNRSWVLGANSRLPHDIRILWVAETTDSFHARFSAVARCYRYIILNTPVASALFFNKVNWQHQSLDDVKMNQAARRLIGEHDFSSFRASGCQAKSPVRNVEHIEVNRKGVLLFIDIKANAFLHHMVRNIAGSLISIGRHEKPVDWLQDILLKRDRTLAAMTASASGLYFVQAYYPEAFKLQHTKRKPVLF